jgi:hypothetical protein
VKGKVTCERERKGSSRCREQRARAPLDEKRTRWTEMEWPSYISTHPSHKYCSGNGENPSVVKLGLHAKEVFVPIKGALNILRV